MKVFLVSIMLLLAFQITAQNSDFKLIKATKQMQYGGVVGSPVVTLYDITVKTKRKVSLSLDSAWAEGKKDLVYIILDSAQVSQKKTLKKGQTIHFAIAIKSENSSLGGLEQTVIQSGSPSAKNPGKSGDKVCITYAGGKSKILSISALTILTPQFGQ